MIILPHLFSHMVMSKNIQIVKDYSHFDFYW